jgi:hypothetical protein
MYVTTKFGCIKIIYFSLRYFSWLYKLYSVEIRIHLFVCFFIYMVLISSNIMMSSLKCTFDKIAILSSNDESIIIDTSIV